jgi:septal ring factor EnvC (AmiA/AmiB activator)
VSDDRADLMLEILKSIQQDIGEIKHELSSVGTRVAALEDHFRGTLTTLYGIQADVSRLKDRVDRIEHRLGLRDTEH